MKSNPLVVIIRGPMGAGKTTLMRGLADHSPYRFWVLDADAAGDFHPSDPHGEHLDDEWPIEVEILALHAKIILGRGLNLVTDSGDLLTLMEVDRFLRIVGRSRREARVVVLRLAVSPETAVKRKTTIAAAYIRRSHKGWQPTPVPGEIVIDVDDQSIGGVRAAALAAIRHRIGTRAGLQRIKLPHTPIRR